MENLDLLSSEDFTSEESVSEDLLSSESSDFVESPSDESLMESGPDGSALVNVDLEPISLVLTDTYTSVELLREELNTTNSLLLCLIFFIVAQWILSKVKGAVERMIQWKI